MAYINIKNDGKLLKLICMYILLFGRT